MHFLLLNGPPQSGKDTVAEFVYRRCNYWHCYLEKFSRPLKAAFTACAGIGAAHWLELGKEDVFPPLGMSPRRFQILLSEKFFKHYCGPNVFTDLLLERVKTLDAPSLVVVSDCGFQAEYNHLVAKVGKENTTLWRIIRPGCTFDEDSREYVETPDTFIVNERSLERLEEIVAKELEKLNAKR